MNKHIWLLLLLAASLIACKQGKKEQEEPPLLPAVITTVGINPNSVNTKQAVTDDEQQRANEIAEGVGLWHSCCW